MLANRDLEQLANFVSKIPLVDETSEEYSSSHRAYWCHKYEGEEYNCPTRRWIEENNDAVMEIKNTVRWNAPGVSSNKVCVAELPAGLCDVNLVKVILEHWYDLFPSSVDIRRGAAMLSFSSSEDAQRLVDKPFNYRGIFYSTSFASQYENREILLIAGLPDALLNSFGVVAAALTKDTGRCLVEPVYFERFGPYLAAVIGIEESSTATLEERLAAITEATKSVIEVDEERYKVFSLGSF
jgi:hypothetical protein